MMFVFYDDETMTRRAGAANGENWLKPITFNTAESNVKDFVLYFGNPDPTTVLKTAENPDVDNIVITPINVLPKWEQYTEYSVGDIVNRDDLVFKCLSGGVSGGGMSGSVGERVADGGVVWQVIGNAHTADDVVLALSRDDLDVAVGGAGLVLGTSIRGGAAIAVYMRINNDVNDLYDTINRPQISLTINSVVMSREYG